MKYDDSIVVIGAGPYGLAVTAYLEAGGIHAHIFGKPLEFWKNMPADLHLKSVWSASSLSDPTRKYSLDRYLEATHDSLQEPISNPFFIKYGQWFQQNAVPNIDPTYVQCLTRDGKRFHLDLTDGRIIKADRVVVATGIAHFAHIPEIARELPGTLASHTQAHSDLSCFSQRKVVVVGSGQSALEYAALSHEAGADVEIIARGRFIWHSRKLYEYSGPARCIFYPPGDVGPPGINWLVSFPFFFKQLPEKMKYPVHKRATRPAGAKWLRPRVEGRIKLTPFTQVIKVTEQEHGLRLYLDDGTERDVDHLLFGTGYRPDIHKLPYIDAALLQQVQEQHGFPVLNTWFESSVPHLYFIGALAGHTFGPICRFLSGAKVPAQQITRHIRQSV